MLREGIGKWIGSFRQGGIRVGIQIGYRGIGPSASVSEVFEYDVLRYLNNPVLLSQARRHIGDQILPHLQNLGVRFVLP